MGWFSLAWGKVKTAAIAAAGLLIAGLAAFGLYQRRRAEAERVEATRQRDRADAASATVKTYRRVLRSLGETEQRHREEEKDAQARLRGGRRDHLDSDW